MAAVDEKSNITFLTNPCEARNPVVECIPYLPFSSNSFSETSETSDIMGTSESGLLAPPTSPPWTSASGASWSPRSTALAQPPSTSWRPISPERLPRLILLWWEGQCWIWRQGQSNALWLGGGHFWHKTRNQMRVAIQSGCVTKILALQMWSKNDFPPEFQNR